MSAKEEIGKLVERSRIAQKQIENYTQEQVDELIRAMVWCVARPGVAEEIAQFTVDETQLGNYDGKYLKIQRKTRATLMDIIHDKSVGILEEDKERAIVKIAKPMGVIGALSPSTNPEATPVIKAIHAIKGRNSIIVAPHPRAKLTNKKICDLMRSAIEACGAPADLVQGIEIPSLDLTNELMAQCDRVLATGGGAMVTAAYSSGTPALGVGVGNAVITVDETADLDDAAEKIRISKTLDFAASCSSDNSVILINEIYENMMSKLKEKGGYLVNDEEKEKLKNTLWDDEGHINTAMVAQPAEKIASMADIKIPEGTQFYIVPESGWGKEHPFSGEKMSVIMALYRADNIDHAIELTNNIQAYQGQGHSCGIYSNSDDNIMKLANATKTSRVMVNQPQAASNSGNLWNGMRQTFSLGCGSWGGNGTNNNISWRDLINETWVSKPLSQSKELMSDEDLFGDVMDKIN
ncbi:MAG: aldehyde dehydrogenase family protein [Hyphomicrobiales bacterium]|jgi:sulfoacetaldehyde dehydrogenase|nr:aldehyde dehydrogenase family protein [Hyphomicrobiales bacterium]MDG1523824.1 aldehyde dehydrogenase family protein [Hyphomicrobiales bacterium]MDG1665113.1 aldehyde dehydrogenase family protein [Hyphomicrobiales bacterium]MDG2413696.1 aldehyde dehydrogenase family protein [Hyphomicrobiales bacterium]|tara:strand:- start:663 stop:2057 length:1395 start_codon:yes stop_codon:yes gene_type:complete